MALTKQASIMEIAAPVLWIQDLKNGNVGGGFATAADTFTTKDINYIARNTILGAGIKPDNTTLVTAKGFQSGDVGKAAIINSPSTGTDNQLSKFVLPVGDYYFELDPGFHPNGYVNSRIYNISDSLQEWVSTHIYGTNSDRLRTGYLTVTGSSKEFRVDVSSSEPADQVNAKGHNLWGASNLISHLDMKIYKIG
jgi:hypothetical protein